MPWGLAGMLGLVVGVVGGQALLWFMRSVPLPSEGLYPLRTLACALVLFGAATLLHGSGFLAVFVLPRQRVSWHGMALDPRKRGMCGAMQ